MSRASTHFVGEKVRALCFVKDVRSSEAHEQFEFLPLVAAGGWDSEVRSRTREQNDWWLVEVVRPSHLLDGTADAHSATT